MNTELFRLCKNTFVRRYDNFGYITNQLTNADRLFDESGAIFLSCLSREAQDFQGLTKKIATHFVDVLPEDLYSDIEEFLTELANDGFIVRGYSEAAIDAAEPSFSYDKVEEIMDAKRKLAAPLDSNGADALSDTQTELSMRFHGDSILFSLQVELTSACNERCIHCYLPATRHQQHADTAH